MARMFGMRREKRRASEKDSMIQDL
eukprot:SAG25_NODE_12355_length_281_cov_1.131868_2_plen_24_part_01